MKIYTVLIWAFLLTSSVFSKENKIYVKGIDSNPSVPSSLTKKIENLIVLSVIRIYPDSNVLSDDASIAILKQGRISQSVGADADFLNYLANSLQFQELITSNLQVNNSIIQLSLQSIQLNTDNKQLTIKNKIFLEFNEWEISYLIPEMVKALQDKSYSISRIPISPESKFKITDLSIPRVNGISLQPMQFTSGDGLPASFLEGVSDYTRKADEEYKNKKFLEASDQYLKIMNSITTLQDTTEKKLKPLITSIQNRILLSTTAAYSDLLRSRDEVIPKNFQYVTEENIWTYFLSYLEDWKKYRALPDYAKSVDIEKAFRLRTEGMIKIYLSRIEFSGDDKYQSLQFKAALIKYRSIEPIWKTYSDFIELSSYQIQISSKINLTMQSGTSYVSGRAKSYLQFAESENSRAILEGSMQNNDAQRGRKELAIQFMNHARNMIEIYPEFLEEHIVANYNTLAVEINSDSEKQTLISPKNIALAPFRYVGNIFRGFTDIFVFKFGYGLGVGGEVFIFGGSPLLSSDLVVEVSTAYGIQTDMEKASSLSQLSETKRANIKGWGNYAGAYGVNIGICTSYFLRFCNVEKDKTFRSIIKSIPPQT